MGSLRWFVLLKANNSVYAILDQFDLGFETRLSKLSAGNHVVSVKAGRSIAVIGAENLHGTLVYISISNLVGQSEEAYVVRNCQAESWPFDFEIVVHTYIHTYIHVSYIFLEYQTTGTINIL